MNAQDVRLLFVWDFDHTIVLDNTDTLVFERLAPDLLHGFIRHRRRRGEQWTAVMDAALDTLARDRGIPAEQVLAAAASAQLPQPTCEALRQIHQCPHAAAAILSDANNLYIDAVLRSHNLQNVFDAGVFTNPAKIMHVSSTAGTLQSRVTVTPFIDGSMRQHHACSMCPPNLCKGELLDQLMKVFVNSIVVYVGDGSNDLCPAIRVPLNGFVLPRANFSLANKLASTSVTATVSPWETPETLHDLIMRIIGSTNHTAK